MQIKAVSLHNRYLQIWMSRVSVAVFGRVDNVRAIVRSRVFAIRLSLLRNLLIGKSQSH